MTTSAVTGPAGYGKTWRLMDIAAAAVGEIGLCDYQRVLALTYMHGARQRLEGRLADRTEFRRRYLCATMDSFASSLVSRWRSMLRHLHVAIPQQDEFDARCDIAGRLLEQPDVANWVATSYPLLLLDEAQDFGDERLRIIKALHGKTRIVLAYDDYQCLDTRLRPSPVSRWAPTVCVPEILPRPQRTDCVDLLTASDAIRNGGAPMSGGKVRIFPAISVHAAAAFLANAIAWNQRARDIAILIPSRTDFTRDVIDRVCTHACGRHQNGPYSIVWESNDKDQAEALIRTIPEVPEAPITEWIESLRRLPDTGPVRHVVTWVKQQQSVFGVQAIRREALSAELLKSVRRQRLFGRGTSSRLRALTIQQAKNREFDGVVVLWPYAVGGDAEQKRRLLYNALTRARQFCTVIVQGKSLPAGAPFH